MVIRVFRVGVTCERRRKRERKKEGRKERKEGGRKERKREKMERRKKPKGNNNKQFLEEKMEILNLTSNQEMQIKLLPAIS